MAIRLYRRSDAARCAEIIQACVDGMPEFDEPTREYFREKNTEAGFAADAARMSFLVVYEHTGIVVGVGGAEEGEISRLYVDPAYWRRGIGAAILRYLEEQSERTGLTSFTVRSSRHSRSFYEAMGYESLGEREQQVGPAKFRWIDMMKQLPSL